MAIVGQLDCTASTNNLIATVSSAMTVNVLIVNHTGNPINVSLALVPNGTSVPANKHWVEYNHSLDGNQALERGGIPLGARLAKS